MSNIPGMAYTEQAGRTVTTVPIRAQFGDELYMISPSSSRAQLTPMLVSPMSGSNHPTTPPPTQQRGLVPVAQTKSTLRKLDAEDMTRMLQELADKSSDYDDELHETDMPPMMRHVAPLLPQEQQNNGDELSGSEIDETLQPVPDPMQGGTFAMTRAVSYTSPYSLGLAS